MNLAGGGSDAVIVQRGRERLLEGHEQMKPTRKFAIILQNLL